MNSAVQVCWEKATRYLEIEEKFVYCTADRYVIDPKEAVALVDENTIGESVYALKAVSKVERGRELTCFSPRRVNQVLSECASLLSTLSFITSDLTVTTCRLPSLLVSEPPVRRRSSPSTRRNPV